MALLQARTIQKSYQAPGGKLSVLKGITLEIREGEITCITGRSGSGKSTLLHVLGLLDRFDSGELFVDGIEIKHLTEKKKTETRNTCFGFVFQFYNLLPELTVFENVLLPALIAKRRGAKEHAQALLERVGLQERIKHFPHQLSGGEQQRVALVRALINDPKIVFCDEPTGNLDEANSDIVMNLIRELNHQNKQAFCIVTHDASLVTGGAHAYTLRSGMLE